MWSYLRGVRNEIRYRRAGDLEEGVDLFCGENAWVLECAEKTMVCFVVDRGDLEVEGAEMKAVVAYDESDEAKGRVGGRHNRRAGAMRTVERITSTVCVSRAWAWLEEQVGKVDEAEEFPTTELKGWYVKSNKTLETITLYKE